MANLFLQSQNIPNIYKGSSIVDFLKSIGQDSSLLARKELAKQFGISNYTGTAGQNTKLLGLLQSTPTPTPKKEQEKEQEKQQAIIQKDFQKIFKQERAKGKSPEQIKQEFAQQMIQAPQAPQAPETLQALPNASEAPKTPQTQKDTLDEALGTPQNAPDNTATLFNELFNEQIRINPFLNEQLKDPRKKALFDQLDINSKTVYLESLKVLGKSIEAGKVINPDIELEPKIVQKFLAQATKDLDPFFREKIGFIQDDLNISLQRMQEDFERSVQRAEEPFKEQLRTQAESEAERGLTFSGGRQVREQKAIQGQSELISDALRKTQRAGLDIGRETERRIGSEAFGNINIPSISGFDVTKEGFTPSTRSLLFQSMGGLLGEIPKEREVAIGTRKSELEEIERQQRRIDRQKLNFG